MRLKTVDRLLQRGTLTLRGPGQRVIEVGHGEPSAEIRLKRRSTLPRILLNPEFEFGQTYMEGGWDPGEGGLLPVFEVIARNGVLDERNRPTLRPLRWLRRLSEINWGALARRNIRHHYDLDDSLYRQFLDADMQYSCAYFARPGMSLEQAQQAKCRHIARKLLLKPGEKVLDIGSGWGGLALFLAREYDVDVTGVTLSERQLWMSRKRAREAGLEDRVRFLGEDYREHSGAYDAIVSVGMFEHVGRPQYPRFFDQVSALLAPQGRALIHSIGRTSPPTAANPWIARYIFPGSYIPALSEMMSAAERSALMPSDCEVWRLHYAETLKHWHLRFQAARERFQAELGERFCRMWEFYLQASEAMFRWGDLVVYQLQAAKDHAAVPLTRDYLYRQAKAADELRHTG